MSFRARLIKIALKIANQQTPKKIIIWVANKILKDIAQLTDFSVDLDARTAYSQILLAGETEAIEVWLDGFGMIRAEENYRIIIQQAHSNKVWLTNIFTHIIGKGWKVPVLPPLTPYMELIYELLKAPY